MTIDRSSPIPLYYQLKQILLEKIEQAEWTPDEPIPSEQKLQETYGLSRTTVRQALDDLVIEGYLNRYRGRGTYLAQPKVADEPSSGLDLQKYMALQGIRLGWRVLDQQWLEPPAFVRSALRLEPGAQVYCLRRLRLADDGPIGYHCAYTPRPFAEQIDHSALTEGESLTYLRKLDLGPIRVHRTLEAVAAAHDDQDLLGLEQSAPVLQLDRLVTDEADAPIEFLRARYRGDRFKYQITL
jgi:GntR family transcriptional regulator